MKAGDVKLGKVFANDHQTVVPLFQRPYVWDVDLNWDPLWKDVRRAAEELEAESLDPPADSSAPPTYFLGAVVVQQRLRSPKRLGSSNVIDGQQRLTTLQVLLAAARQVACQLEGPNVAARFSSLIENRSETVDEEFPQDRYKVWPLPQDRPAFLWATRAPESISAVPADPSHRLTRAREWFEQELLEWAVLAERPLDRLDHLFFALSDRMLLVEITLSQTDDPQVIFEALNHRGVRLAAVDLVKNLLFQLVDKQERAEAENLLEDFWLELDGKYWREEVTTGRIKRVRADLLLTYWLTIESEKEVLVEHLFADFKKWVVDHKLTGSHIIRSIRRIADTYRTLTQLPEDHPAFGLIDSMQATGTNTPWPVLLFVFSNDEIPEIERLQASAAIDSYLMRRGVCGLTAKDYNRLFLQALVAARVAPLPNAGTAVVDCLAGQDKESRNWPEDGEFVVALMSSSLYETVYRARLKAFLVCLENSLRTSKTTGGSPLRCDDKKLNIEHLLPQKWSLHWPLPVDVDEADVRRRSDAVHRLGNLTLASVSLNSGMSNNPWPVKKGDLQTHSLVVLTTGSVLSVPPTMPKWTDEAWTSAWDEERVLGRGAYLAMEALKRWPRPKGAHP